MTCSGGILLLRSVVLVVCVLFSLTTTRAQGVQVAEEKEGYTQTIAKRVEKIVTSLQSTDSILNSKLKNIIIDQYYNLGITHDARNSQIRAIKDQNRELTEDDKDHIRRIEANTQQQLEQLHKQFLARLGELCTPQQIDQIKDGMTYGVLQVTYKAYQDMLPDLNSEQKKQILAWLTEARELAMDAESSEKKHAVFGKYKGRINNYLSAAGIDMKKAEADWQKRIKERTAAEQK
jgi:hypothetical protein